MTSERAKADREQPQCREVDVLRCLWRRYVAPYDEDARGPNPLPGALCGRHRTARMKHRLSVEDDADRRVRSKSGQPSPNVA